MTLVDLSNSPIVIHPGIVYSRLATGELDKKTPLYYIELVNEDAMQVVTVYRVNTNLRENETPTKAKTIVKQVVNNFLGNSPLSALAKEKFPKKEIITTQDAPPLYMDVVYQFKDTFTGIEESGFFERKQDTILPNGTVAQSQPTGVFIGLSSVYWLPPLVNLKDAINEYQINKSIWLGMD